MKIQAFQTPISKAGPNDIIPPPGYKLINIYCFFYYLSTLRRLHIGYPRAARIMEQLEEEI
jgi:hypothetical protein